jgi:hypothetical protein
MVRVLMDGLLLAALVMLHSESMPRKPRRAQNATVAGKQATDATTDTWAPQS